MELRELNAKNLVAPAFKQTEAGQIPQDWNVQKVSGIGKVIRGASPRPKGDKRFYGGDIPRLMVEDVSRDGKYVHPQIDSLTEEGAKRSRPCKAGTLTLVCSGVVGIPSFLAIDACIHDGFLALIGIRKTMSDDYLYHQFVRLRESFESSATHGGVFTNLTTAGVREFVLPTPPTAEEQQVIAAALSDADALIESLEQLLAKKRQVKQGAMQELLTGKRRLTGFAGVWVLRTLGDLLSIRHGKGQKEVESTDGPYPILATGGQIGTANRFLYDKPSVLIGRKGTINQPQFMDAPFWTVDTLFYSEMKEQSSAKFLFYRFCLIDWMQYNEASGVPSLNARTIEAVEILCPAHEEQTAIAAILSDMDADITTLEAKLAKARAIKQGMMQELLTGRIRLVEKEAA